MWTRNVVEFGYDTRLVIVSITVAILICYATLAVEQLLLNNLYFKAKKIIVVFAGFVLATAIWSMHFVGMFACYLPKPYHFTLGFAVLSYLMVALSAIVALALTTHKNLSLGRLCVASAVLALGMVAMHYIGMQALVLQQYAVTYHFTFSVISFFMAWFGAAIALWVSFKIKHTRNNTVLLRGFTALIMAMSIVGMHYTAMLATVFHPLNHVIEKLPENDMIIFSIIFIVCMVLMVIVFIALLELRLKERNKQLHEANQELTALVKHDHLTKLPNRVYLIDHAKMVLSEHRLHRQPLAVLYIDLDRFKAINDAFGHHVGDEVLIQFVARILPYTQKNKLFRISGDEFFLIAEHTALMQAEKIAQDIVVSMQHGFKINGRDIKMTTSIGIAMFPEHGENLQELLMHADIAMLLSKEQGRNSYTVFNYRSEQYVQRHQSKLINDLFSAIEKKQFVLFYQPKFDSQRNICGVEALIRWQHSTLGLLGPNIFIPLAEKTGQIIPIGYWVMEEACKQIRAWEQANKPYFPISINLSAIQIEQEQLVEKIQRHLIQYQVDPQHLIIEVTESTAMHQIDSSIQKFQKIRNLGVRLSIDDFGTGHSSFLYLKDLPVDELKIDRGFIRNLHHGSKDEIILESIIHLTQNLGLTITAEGVENEEQFEILKRLGCEQFQGFLLGKPVPKEVLEMQFNLLQ